MKLLEVCIVLLTFLEVKSTDADSRFNYHGAQRRQSLNVDSCNWCGKGHEETDPDKKGFQGRIVNGYRPNHRPWMVFLKMHYTDRSTSKCGGALLTKRWIVSAGHCFCEKEGYRLCERQQTRVGKVLRLLKERDGGDMKEIVARFGINDLTNRHSFIRKGTVRAVLSNSRAFHMFINVFQSNLIISLFCITNDFYSLQG